MKLVKPFFDIVEQSPGLGGIYKIIEIAGRTCYKSSDKITKDSADKFVEMLIKRGHTAMLEHGTVYLQFTYSSPMMDRTYLDKVEAFKSYKNNKYSHVNSKSIDAFMHNVYITTNYRVLVENGWLSDLQYQCEPTEFHEKRIAVRFTCDRGVSHEFVRHRVFSFAQESTRYCNYSKDSFGKELTYIIPCWEEFPEGSYYESVSTLGSKTFMSDDYFVAGSPFMDALGQAEDSYFELLDRGFTPQQARSVLPNSLKTELVMTGTVKQWKGFFELRCAKAAHPQARELAEPLEQEFIKRKLL